MIDISQRTCLWSASVHELYGTFGTYWVLFVNLWYYCNYNCNHILTNYFFFINLVAYVGVCEYVLETCKDEPCGVTCVNVLCLFPGQEPVRSIPSPRFRTTSDGATRFLNDGRLTLDGVS